MARGTTHTWAQPSTRLQYQKLYISGSNARSWGNTYIHFTCRVIKLAVLGIVKLEKQIITNIMIDVTWQFT